MTTRNKNIPALRFKGFEGEWESKSGSDIFISSRRKGDEDLPIYSVTLDRGMVPRNSLERNMLSDAKATDSLFVAKNDIAYNMMRMWQGAYGLSPENCMVSPAYVVLHPKPNISSDFFISYFARSRSLYLFTAYSYGLTSDRLRLYFKDFAQIKFAVPKLSEQQKIASFLSAIDEKIRQLTRRKALLEQYKKGVMQQLFSGKLRFKPAPHEVAGDEKGKAYPKWEEKRLGDVGDIVTGKTPSTSDLDLWGGEIQFITPTDIDGNKYQVKTQRTITKLSTTKILPSKSIIFTCIASIGKMSLSIKPCITNQQINSIIPFKEFDNEYIYYSLLNIVDYIKSTQSTTTLPIINKTEFSKIKIQVPTYFPEQQKIASFLSSIDTKIESVTAQIERTQRYKKGLLQQMFV